MNIFSAYLQVFILPKSSSIILLPNCFFLVLIMIIQALNRSFPMYRIKTFTLLFYLAFFSQNVFSSEIEDLVFDMEEKLQGKFPVSPLDALKTRIGGLIKLDSHLTNNEGIPNSSHNDSAGTTNTRVDLMIEGELNQDVTFNVTYAFANLTFLKNPDGADRSYEKRRSFKFFYRAWMNYNIDPKFQIKIGRYVTPFTRYADTYSPMAEKAIDLPEYVLTTGLFYPLFLDGIRLHGSTKMADTRLTYSLYGGVYSYFGDSPGYNATDIEMEALSGYPQNLVYGTRLVWDLFNNNLSLGLSALSGKRIETYKAYSLDMKLSLGKFKMTIEGGWTDESSVNDICSATELNTEYAAKALAAAAGTSCNQGTYVTSDAANLITWSKALKDYYTSRADSNKKFLTIEPYYWFNQKWMLAGRWDYIDMSSPLWGNGGSYTIKSLALNYLPFSNLMFKAGWSFIDYEKENSTNEFTSTSVLNAVVNADRVSGAQQIDPDYHRYFIGAYLSF